MTHKEKIEAFYQDYLTYCCVPPDSKMEFIGCQIFDFTTYDGALDVALAVDMFEVIEAILNQKQFEYHQASERNYRNYILMCNMPFLADKLEWGGSIRGAWFETYWTGKVACDNIEVTNIKEFFTDLIEWSKE